MGRAKDELIRREELEPMYEWIEDNFGSDAGEEDSEAWDEAVQAWEDHCDEVLKQEELEWYIAASQSQIGRFDIQMQSVLELLGLTTHDQTHFSLLVMLHGHTVAAVESYLASTFIHRVTNSDDLIRKLIESDPVFSERTFTLKEIYQKHESLKLEVATYLKTLIFHRLKKVKPMFKDVLDLDFGDISWLFKAVEIRHHCVHRGGLDKEGEKVGISAASIMQLVDDSMELVWAIERKLEVDAVVSEPQDIIFPDIFAQDFKIQT